MGSLKIMLTMVVVLVFGHNMVTSAESGLAETICKGITAGVNFLYCLYNYPLSEDCLNNKLSISFYSYEKGFIADILEDDIDYKASDPPQFKSNMRTTIIIHGYLASREANWITPMIEALLDFQTQKTNVIVVQWYKNIRYSKAAEAVNEVATETAKMVKNIFKEEGKPKYLHIIGHSLGAHIAGLTASKLNSSSWTVDRVTALDPAKPFFDEEKNSALKLNKNCAKFVDVIHTNGGPQNEQTFGLYEPVGHLDYYPNGGDRQPDCVDPQGRSIDDNALNKCLEHISLKKTGPALASNFINRLVEGSNMICDHEKAPKYFIQSLRGKRFYSTKVESLEQLTTTSNRKLSCTINDDCRTDDSCAEMGIYASNYRKDRQGIFLLKTNCNSAKPTESLSLQVYDYLFHPTRGIFSW